jgi:opacity protein-like surface antigen
MVLRSVPLVLGIVIANFPEAAFAQRGSEATIMVRLFGGSSLSQPALWDIPRQPVLVPGTELSPIYDTLHLTRSITTGITLGAGLLYFPTSLLGFELRLSFQGLGVQSACNAAFFYQLGMRHDNESLCSSIQQQSYPLHLYQLTASAVLRAAPRSGVSPFVSAGAGIADINASTVYLEGADTNGIRVVLNDPNPRSIAWVLRLGAGAAVSLGSDYQFYFAVDDMGFQLERVTGPANHLAQAPTAARFFSNAVFSFGLDIVLGGRRGRRY